MALPERDSRNSSCGAAEVEIRRSRGADTMGTPRRMLVTGGGASGQRKAVVVRGWPGGGAFESLASSVSAVRSGGGESRPKSGLPSALDRAPSGHRR